MQFFQKKFAITTVIGNQTKIRKLWVHLDYDHMFISLTSKYGKFLPQSNIFLVNNNLLSIKFEICLPFSKWVKYEILVSKYGHLILPEAFQDQVNPDIDFTDEAVVHCDVPVVKRLL